MNKKLIIICLLAAVMGSACYSGGDDNARAIEAPAPTPPLVQAVTTMEETPLDHKTPYTVFVEDDQYKLALYEPAQGCYLGAYILSNKKVGFDIEAFETEVKKPHGLYMYNMVLGDYFPTNWVLSCIANMKTPYVVLKATTPLSATDWNILEETAISFGEFYVPIFVEFNPMDASVSKEAAISDYQKTRAMFNKHASNVAFVWSVDMADVAYCIDYYPGDDYVDWVGLNIIETLDTEKSFKGDVLDALDQFYQTFQKQKPMLISRFAVSHFSNRDFVYQTNAAAAEIKRFYAALESDYSRVKAVIYMDFNALALNGERKMKDDFSLTGESAILNAYNEVTDTDHFINEVAISSEGDLSTALYTSAFEAYKANDTFYVSEKSLRYDLGVSNFALFKNYKTLTDTRYFDASSVEGLMKRMRFKEKKK